MPRFPASLSVLAVSALLAGTALAATPEPQSSSETLLQSVETGLRDAQTKRAGRDFTGAVRVLSQLMLVAADDPRVVSEYGKVLVQEGRAREALDFLNRAAQLAQGDWSVYSALGVAYDQTGDFANARAAYERALTLSPGSTTVLNNFAMSRALAGDLPMAKKLIADASAGSKDERITRNLKMINSLTPKAGTPAQAVASVPMTAPLRTTPVTTAPLATATPRTITPAEGKKVVSQAVPSDPKAGPVGKKPRKATATAAAAKPPVSKPLPSGIPSLRLANDRQ